jgi:hypothetical protein
MSTPFSKLITPSAATTEQQQLGDVAMYVSEPEEPSERAQTRVQVDRRAANTPPLN